MDVCSRIGSKSLRYGLNRGRRIAFKPVIDEDKGGAPFLPHAADQCSQSLPPLGILIAHFISGDEQVRTARVKRALSSAPAWLSTLTIKMVAKDPADRPTAAQVVEELEAHHVV